MKEMEADPNWEKAPGIGPDKEWCHQEWWNGEKCIALPPIDTECEINTEYGWLPCAIIAHGPEGSKPDYAIGHIQPNEWDLKVDWSRWGFRPLEKTDREKLIDILHSPCCQSRGGC